MPITADVGLGIASSGRLHFASLRPSGGPDNITQIGNPLASLLALDPQATPLTALPSPELPRLSRISAKTQHRLIGSGRMSRPRAPLIHFPCKPTDDLSVCWHIRISPHYSKALRSKIPESDLFWATKTKHFQDTE